MGNLFIDILETTLPMSVMIAVLLLFSPLIKRAYVAKWRYYMWLFTAVRLILPFRFTFRTPITMEIPSGVMEPAAAARAAVTPLRIMTLIWLSGIVIFAVYRIACYFSFKKMVSRWQRSVMDKTVEEEFALAKSFAGVRRDIDIKMCKAVTTPMVFGLVKPVLLMPDIEFTRGELSIILRHELVHLKRWDILYKLLLMVVCTIHWFNPMVYAMAKAADRDLELACDAEVVKHEGNEYRYRYCEAIMRLVHNRSGAKTALSTCFFFSKKAVMERFRHILDEKIKRSGVIMFCVVAFSVALSGGAVTFATERVADEFEDNLQILEREITPPRSTSEPEQTPPLSTADSANDAQNGRETQPLRREYDDAQPVSVSEVYEYEYDEEPAYEEPPQTAAAADDTVSDTPQAADMESGGVDEVSIGSERESIYSAMGEPSSVSGDGSRETYDLPDGNKAVLQYDGEVLDSGYIVVN